MEKLIQIQIRSTGVIKFHIVHRVIGLLLSILGIVALFKYIIA